ncbi:lactonase family protein [Faecalicatena sp. AGMB00832]|uniref:Lactonase family protein n=1 Tax=Faecalicatena faecalis TaxID=2726362 RepID=A0ABS6D3S9_9FIRM|nr:beta-propeller fold lactonase family protein [Faecalicatena faecalis]MBU3876244.1 lactonase family protein [Faecalicatena faecalis]
MNLSVSHILTGYLGTYASPQSKGIYRFSLDTSTGQLSKPELYYEALDCKYLSLYKGLLAAPVQKGDDAGISLLNVTSTEPVLLDHLFKELTTSCFITQDENFIYTANYHEGLVLIYQKTGQGITPFKRIEIAPKAGCHQIIFHDGLLLVPCLLLDEIRIFDPEQDFHQIGVIPFPPKTGPRHGIFTRDHRHLFVVSELSNELYLFAVEKTPGNPAPNFRLMSVHPLLEQSADFTTAPTSAAIRLSPDERYLYISTRFADVISVFELKQDGAVMIQQTGSGGIHPRDILLTPDGRYLLAVNRTEGGLVCFPVDSKNGMLGPICSRVPAFEAVSIVLDETDCAFQ